MKRIIIPIELSSTLFEILNNCDLFVLIATFKDIFISVPVNSCLKDELFLQYPSFGTNNNIVF